MANESKSFDLREFAGDLIGLVRNRAQEIASNATRPAVEQIQTAVLSTLNLESGNAAEITKSIALASAGSWKPSAGDIQQTLKTLEANKLVTAKLDGDRKVYSITKAGRAELKSTASKPEENEKNVKESANLGAWMDCKPEFLRAATKLAPAMLDIAQTGSKAQQAAAAAVLDQTRHQLHSILAEE